jgi:hypothetical protein
MRWSLIVVALAAGTANAKDCAPPTADKLQIEGLRAFSECVNEKIAALETENARLLKELEKIQISLKKTPGEFLNENGSVTRSGGQSLVQATFIATARRREGPAALPIDQEVLESLCAVGCSMNLLIEGEALRKGDPGSVSDVATCLLRYSARTGAWSQGGGCGDAVSGIDGDGKPPGKVGGEVIASSGGACILADSEPSRSFGTENQLLEGDRTKGLYLIAAPAFFLGTEARFRCELKFVR